MATTKKKPAKTAATSPADAWARIERWFSAHHPSLDLKLRPGANDRAIAAAEKKLGVTFPDDFRASLRVHDGQENEPDVRLWPWGQRLGSLDGLTRCWKDDRGLFDQEEMAERFEWLSDDGRVRQVHPHPAHVPIAGSTYWDYSRLLLDYVPGPKGTTGQVIARDDVDFVFVCPTFGELLERTARGLEDGTIAVKAGDYDSALEYRTKKGKAVPAAKYFA